MKENKKKLLSSFLKIGITVFLLYFVFTKIPFSEIWTTLKEAQPFYLLVALVLFIASQWASSHRLLLLFNAATFFLKPLSNYILYLIGMFYNFFIPGGIGGDAYKVYILHKKFSWPIKKLTSAIFIDRFIGLTAIGILIVLLGFFIPFLAKENLLWTLPVLLVLGVLTSFFIVKKWFSTYLKIYPTTLLLSILVQLLQCAAVLALLASISNFEHAFFYLLVFLISSVLSIFSFSGIGVREILFYQASTWLLYDSTTAVTIGILFSALTAFVSLFGILFQFKNTDSYIQQL